MPPLCALARFRTFFPPFAPTEFMVFYRWRRHREASERYLFVLVIHIITKTSAVPKPLLNRLTN